MTWVLVNVEPILGNDRFLGIGRVTETGHNRCVVDLEPDDVPMLVHKDWLRFFKTKEEAFAALMVWKTVS